MKSEDYIAYGAPATLAPALFSKKHVIAIGSTVTLVTALSMVLPSFSPDLSSEAEFATEEHITSVDPGYDPNRPLSALYSANTEEVALNASLNDAADQDYDDDLPMSALDDPDTRLDQDIAKLAAREENTRVSSRWVDEDVSKGDTLTSIFSDLNISRDSTYTIVNLPEVKKAASNLKIGNQMSFLLSDKNELLVFVLQLDKGNQLRVYRTDPSNPRFAVTREPYRHHVNDTEEYEIQQIAEVKPAERPSAAAAAPASKPTVTAAAEPPKPALSPSQRRGRLVVASIPKGGTFSTAAHSAGLTYTEINLLIKMFKGKIQFSQLHAGDTMRVLFSDTAGKGKIMAVEFKIDGKKAISSYRSSTDNKFYDENGYAPVTKGTFRRFPLNGNIRVTSNFNPNRRHPVTGRVRPHNGTDFGVRVGTPVVSTADGIVLKATYSKGAGYYVVIRHRDPYSTVYMHLSKIMVKPGDHVKMGQTIARSGNTGLSTGPHLHFELRINNRPVNAMRVKLPTDEETSVSKQQRQRFKRNVAQYKRELYDKSLMAKR